MLLVARCCAYMCFRVQWASGENRSFSFCLTLFVMQTESCLSWQSCRFGAQYFWLFKKQIVCFSSSRIYIYWWVPVEHSYISQIQRVVTGSCAKMANRMLPYLYSLFLTLIFLILFSINCVNRYQKASNYNDPSMTFYSEGLEALKVSDGWI